MKFLFSSLVSLARCLKLLKMREVIIVGYENSSRLHSSEGLGWWTWRIVLINSCSAKGRWYWGNKQVRAKGGGFGLQPSPKEDAVYRQNWTVRGRSTRQPLWKFSFDKRGRKRTSTHPLSSTPLTVAVSSNPLSFAYATWASESQTFGWRLNRVKDQTSIYSTSYEYV
jgi:hypothetical protein